MRRFAVSGRRAWLLCVFLLGSTCAAPVVAVDLLRCGANLAGIEATNAKVLEVCGEPSYRDRWSVDTHDPQAYAENGEVWYYNFGPSQLVRVLEFHRGRLATVDTDGYGFVPVDDPRCSPDQIVAGLSKYRLLSFCGEPFSHRGGSVLSPMMEQNRIFRGYYREAPRSDYVKPVYREEWIYNFSSRARTRKVVLENGWVTDVITGDRGFDLH